jgi:hypothetical protein
MAEVGDLRWGNGIRLLGYELRIGPHGHPVHAGLRLCALGLPVLRPTAARSAAGERVRTRRSSPPTEDGSGGADSLSQSLESSCTTASMSP